MGSLDLRYVFRNLARTPGFTTVAVLTLALGIGANTAIFSIVNGVLLKPLAFDEPGQLVFVQETVDRFKHLYPTVPVNARHFSEWGKNSKTIDSLALMGPAEINLTGAGEPERLVGARVSAALLPVLRVQPQIGRNFLEEEDQPGRDNVAIITDALWRRRFGADPALVGRTVTLDGAAHVVVGILAPSFEFPPALQGWTARDVRPPDVIKPIAIDLKDAAPMGEFNYGCVARLKRGVPAARATAELDTILANFIASMKDDRYTTRAVLMPLQDHIVGKSRDGLVLVLAAVGAVLLMVCVNVANLTLARTAARKREAAVRTALGASRLRILRQALTESAVVSAGGGLLGIAAAYAGLGVLLRNAPVNLPRLNEVTLDARVLLFALGLTAATAVLAGLIPAWRLAGTDPQEALRAGGRSMSEGGHGVRLRNVLIGLEVGLSTVLVIVAGLLMTSFLKLMQVDKGFNPERLMAAQVGLPVTKYQDGKAWQAFLDRLLPRIEALPGVTSAAVVSALPLKGETWVDMLTKEGETRPPFERPMSNMRFASTAYFRTMGVPIVKGRAFEERDRERLVMIVSSRAAQALWPGEDPIGKKLHRGFKEPFSEVIGVAGDVRAAIDKDPPVITYMPYWQRSRSQFFIVVRTAMDPKAMVRAVREQVWKEDADIPVPEMLLMDTVVSDAAAQRRFQLWLIGVFAIAALALACLGIYGVVAHAVARRTNEMGVRMALGARGVDLMAMVLKQGLAPVAVGLVLGIAASLALARVLRSLLFQVSATDPRIIVAAVALLSAVAIAACLLPARRASRVDPIIALRYE